MPRLWKEIQTEIRIETAHVPGLYDLKNMTKHIDNLKLHYFAAWRCARTQM